MQVVPEIGPSETAAIGRVAGGDDLDLGGQRRGRSEPFALAGGAFGGHELGDRPPVGASTGELEHLGTVRAIMHGIGCGRLASRVSR